MTKWSLTEVLLHRRLSNSKEDSKEDVKEGGNLSTNLCISLFGLFRYYHIVYIKTKQKYILHIVHITYIT